MHLNKLKSHIILVIQKQKIHNEEWRIIIKSINSEKFPLKSPKNYFFQRSIFSLPLEVQGNTILIMARFKGLNEFRRLSSSNRIPCMCVNPFLFSRYSSPPLYGIQFLSKWSYRRVIASSFRGNDLSLSLSLSLSRMDISIIHVNEYGPL